MKKYLFPLLAYVTLAAWVAVVIACAVTGPTETPTSVPPPAAVAPSPTAPPAGGPVSTDARVYGDGSYSVTNETNQAQFYCAASFGVTLDGKQTYIEGTEQQGITAVGDRFEGQGATRAECKYDRIQIDLTQSKDCRKFDWHNVLAARTIPNPNYGPEMGTVTVHADQHSDGTYLYEVRAGSTVVWSKKLARGAVASFNYPPDAKRLELWLNLGGGAWEFDSIVYATCGDVQAAWNERIEYACGACK